MKSAAQIALENTPLQADATTQQDPDEQQVSLPFIDELRTRVMADYLSAQRYLSVFHQECLARSNMYHNAQAYQDLKKQDKFPVPIMQQEISDFRSDMLDKLFYTSRPATIKPGPGTAQDDADAKQAMLAYQDDQDDIYLKTSQALKGVALNRITAAKVDYKETYVYEWQEIEQTIDITDPMTGQAVPQVIGKRWQQVPVPDFMGATVSIIDIHNLFFTQDKKRVGDGMPVMVRSWEDKNYFWTEPYFINQEQIQDKAGANTVSGDTVDPEQKRQIGGLYADRAQSAKPYEYLEWQGFVKTKDLYDYFNSIGRLCDVVDMQGQPQQIPYSTDGLDEHHQCFCVVGIVDGQVVVRLDDDPLKLGRENIVLGVMGTDEEGVIGESLGQLVEAIHAGSEVLMGLLIENMKQSVNAFSIINTTMLAAKGQITINKAGVVLETTGDVNQVYKRVEQPRVAPELFELMNMFRQYAQDAGGRTDLAKGQGDPAAQTLGEANIAASKAAVRSMALYLKSFENSWVKPLYELRNHVNATFLDQDYIFQVEGEQGAEWQKISPSQMRARVRFVCESSSRETNRAILVQQILQLIQVAPFAQQAGQPVRFDKIIAKMCKLGFSWSQEEIEEILPGLRLEREGGVDYDAMLLQHSLLQNAIGMVNTAMGGNAGADPGGAPSPNQQLPQPTTDSGATAQLGKKSQTKIGQRKP